MKARKSIVLLSALLLTSTVSPMFVGADTIDDLNSQESDLNNQADSINSQINSAMDQAQATADQIDALSTSVADNQEKLVQTQADIETTKANIEERKAAVAERMQDIQLNGSSERDWQALLDVESITDFVNRVYAMTVLQNAENDKIESLNTEQAKLEELETQLADTQAELEANQADLETQSAAYITQVNDLKVQLANNQDALAGVVASKEEEEARIAAQAEADRLAAEQAAADAQAEADRLAAEQAQAAETPVAQPETNSNTNNSGSTGSTNNGNSNSGSTGGSSTVTDAEELAAKEWIAMKESGGSYTVYSASGQHYGRYQLLLSYLGGDLSPENQERVADNYVKQRYGSWVAAKAYHLSHNWY
ncbi:aggregation-promoting factor C-terminal-like domain-containing protein [Enterococcus sp. LJL120]